MYMIVGAAGFLGSYLIDELLKTSDETIIAVYHGKSAGFCDERIRWISCDITDFESVRHLNAMCGTERKKVVFCAACHNPDFVQREVKTAWNVNIVALANFLNAVDGIEALIYPSTDAVYGNSVDGHKYIEASRLRPVNLYGRQKALAEQIVTTYGYHAVRLPFMIGRSLAPGKTHFYDTIVSTIQRGGCMEMFVDSYRCTLSFRQAARYILRLIEAIGEREIPKILNVCSDYALSKYDVGIMIADYTGVSRDLIKPVFLKDRKEIFQTQRAESALMDNTLMKEVLGIERVRMDVELC